MQINKPQRERGSEGNSRVAARERKRERRVVRAAWCQGCVGLPSYWCMPASLLSVAEPARASSVLYRVPQKRVLHLNTCSTTGKRWSLPNFWPGLTHITLMPQLVKPLQSQNVTQITPALTALPATTSALAVRHKLSSGNDTLRNKARKITAPALCVGGLRTTLYSGTF